MIEHRVLLGVRAAYGSLLLVRPSSVCTVLAGRPPDTVTCATAGVLGVRHLAQAALTARLGPRAAPAGVATDLAHALSMLVLATVVPDRRRICLTDAAIATAFCLAGTERFGRAAATAARDTDA
ncbi:hypothetical protein [Kitasatospora aureofaciens]|uniref:hypothetical protein n=1 Tax=Kitasatospora aureofaciens TaxID=1894 RepID=UPI0037C6555F